MTNILVILAIVCILMAFILMGWNLYHTKKTFNAIEEVVDSAIDGSFSERIFDESRISSLETKLADYLSASWVTSHNIEEEKNRMNTMISDISHQTKTPIANLLLYSELLGEQELGEVEREYVRALYLQAEKLRFLIDSLMKLSRLENGILTVNVKRAKLQPLLESVQQQFLSVAAEKGLFLEFEPSTEEAIFDPKWTNEALCNLVDNAIKYTRQGGVKVFVTAYELFTCIQVADTGVGICEEEQSKVFARFFRSANVSEEEGVGIGLYLTRKIITDQGGYIKLTSKVGEGSTFALFLPR